jgi:hypothetical protein
MSEQDASYDGDFAFRAIEAAASVLVEAGWKPEDAEPGEWLILESPDGKHRISVTAV